MVPHVPVVINPQRCSTLIFMFSIRCNNENTAAKLEFSVSDIYVHFRPLECLEFV